MESFYLIEFKNSMMKNLPLIYVPLNTVLIALGNMTAIHMEHFSTASKSYGLTFKATGSSPASAD